MRAKNLMVKFRKPGDAYVTLRGTNIDWTWEVLKSWQANGAKPYARVFCNVHGYEEEMGDVYVLDIAAAQPIVAAYDHSVFASAKDAWDAVFGVEGGK